MTDWLKNFFSIKYLFNTSPKSSGYAITVLLIYFIILIVIGLVLAYFINKKVKKISIYKKLRDKILSDFLAFGFTGLILLFFRYQEIPLFSAPIILLVFLLVNIVVFWYILIFYIKQVLPATKKLPIEENYRKYLPTSKHKK